MRWKTFAAILLVTFALNAALDLGLHAPRWVRWATTIALGGAWGVIAAARRTTP